MYNGKGVKSAAIARKMSYIFAENVLDYANSVLMKLHSNVVNLTVCT